MKMHNRIFVYLVAHEVTYKMKKNWSRSDKNSHTDFHLKIWSEIVGFEQKPKQDLVRHESNRFKDFHQPSRFVANTGYDLYVTSMLCPVDAIEHGKRGEEIESVRPVVTRTMRVVKCGHLTK
jgi:hypothetical protein